ncbi:hypothetical protein SERLADRAFT_358952 [Serpula lacrymans var. lacrymans S7.9]|uniref:HD/PDEase domain-containing protein n=1 Tax=Serpula lacrymans var. lacrymans (strain S7.9) TaxID=578457 RepID=F8ND83_SERL9|nr:uncharacterized protein SERLADRAFT_358952 [Serpula lacrymans var. lacrymans S7.9]EGO30167.1 hypothetical protein SERLADRAFT_358952 [Serpula lacrymans var. lacrymans S7.9]
MSLIRRSSHIFNRKHFQRLRLIKQLGVSYYVWPGASHNRFEHCLGVGHLARRMVEHIKSSQPSLGINDHHIKCIELAGLCHDLGHGPWSHVWDGLFIPKALNGKRWKHEDASELMFDHMIKEYRLKITPKEATFIKALIAGDTTRCEEGKDFPFLFEIVANKRNGIDVDKFDYIARDCHAIGEKGNLSLTRLIHSARVINNQICYGIKDAEQIYELCYTRFSLHKRIYNHKTAKAIEYMVIDALLAAEPIMKFAEQIDKPDRYVFLTDDILSRIEMTTDEELQPSRDIIERIRTRDLYKLVDFKVFSWEFRNRCQEYITPERIVEAAHFSPPPGADKLDLEELTPEDIIVNLSPMHYGMQERNPLDFVRFYSKRNPNICRPAEPGDISLLMPSSFAEVLLRIYTKEERFVGIVQAAYREILMTLPDHVPQSPLRPAQDAPTATLTPPATEAPSTPRALSRNVSLSQIGVTPFSNNEFTTVPPNFHPTSPERGTKKPRSKRGRDTSGMTDTGSPPRKRRA